MHGDHLQHVLLQSGGSLLFLCREECKSKLFKSKMSLIVLSISFGGIYNSSLFQNLSTSVTRTSTRSSWLWSCLALLHLARVRIAEANFLSLPMRLWLEKPLFAFGVCRFCVSVHVWCADALSSSVAKPYIYIYIHTHTCLAISSMQTEPRADRSSMQTGARADPLDWASG